ncbi:aldo/keto reductase [Brachyspira hyodysenteriae]|uniref:aldo/keto reductase n=1 Tax=Brachyspira hyodysenteriae TaxID=159 RepID=UPI00063DBBFE|nr:aldo/keto reductase [Brachyspira hyodysenteriae]KLI42660.1 oxidoreductase [Brachyspira hyodysenteriae]MCZ9837830.1 aldo/keto reductase [Brachyspira hyodysenteriae]MCZ9848948.1 aldo/keto reductase [Brachyspira hyodysenteriae]MCZ9850053.1 aldo/keto reductase [Brachyspira hyodysenteriae]MCZ9861124.1 aldo/keto reductase [Brachyspira hyodysenteriae]
MSNFNSLKDTFTLNNGYKIPCIGFGTWQTPDGETAINSVIEAIKSGYKHIDTAAVYGNEKSIGKAIKESGINRNELFVTSKVWNKDRGYKTTLAAFEKTLNDLQLDYLDLYLIHWPASVNKFNDWDNINLETWKAMTELYKAGKIKSIGVSNFMPHHLKSLMETEIKPMVNQIEFHPGFMQEETFKYCNDNNILVEAWSPLGTGKMLNNETLKSIASKYNKSAAQLCIRWCLQNNTLPLPKSVTASRIKENTEIFDFVISDEDMKTINAMEYFGGSGHHPDKVNF